MRKVGCDVVLGCCLSFREREGTSVYVYLEKGIGEERKKGFLEEKQMLK